MRIIRLLGDLRVSNSTPSNRIVLIHGWNVRDGGLHTIGALREPLINLGYKVNQAAYGWVVGYWTTKLRSRRFAMTIAPQLEEGDIIIAHSNGCRIALEISQRVCCNLGPQVWLHPALDHYLTPSCRVPKVLVVHSKLDWATRLAKLIPFSPWGDMGTKGYLSEGWSNIPPDDRMINLDDGFGHNNWTDPDNLENVVGTIHNFISSIQRRVSAKESVKEEIESEREDRNIEEVVEEIDHRDNEDRKVGADGRYSDGS